MATATSGNDLAKIYANTIIGSANADVAAAAPSSCIYAACRRSVLPCPALLYPGGSPSSATRSLPQNVMRIYLFAKCSMAVWSTWLSWVLRCRLAGIFLAFSWQKSTPTPNSNQQVLLRSLLLTKERKESKSPNWFVNRQKYRKVAHSISLAFESHLNTFPSLLLSLSLPLSFTLGAHIASSSRYILRKYGALHFSRRWRQMLLVAGYWLPAASCRCRCPFANLLLTLLTTWPVARLAADAELRPATGLAAWPGLNGTGAASACQWSA